VAGGSGRATKAPSGTSILGGALAFHGDSARLHIAPGQGVVFDLNFPETGKYPSVNHSMRNRELGAAGLIDVSR
jgi:hypothetical protein